MNKFELPPFATIFPDGENTDPDFIRRNLGQMMNHAGLNQYSGDDRARFKNKIFAERVPTEWITRSQMDETLMRLLNTLRGWTPALASIETPTEKAGASEITGGHVRSDANAFEIARRERGEKSRKPRRGFKEQK